MLAPLLSKGDVELLLKLLQTFSALLLSYPAVHDNLLALTLRFCFQLQTSKIQVVSSTAAATVRQTVMIVFEKVVEEDKVLDGIKDGGEDAAVAAPLAVARAEISGRDHVTLFPSSADAYKVLCDLNRLAQEEGAPFLELSSLPCTFTLELIESILTNHAALIRGHPELLSTLRESTCPLLLKALNEKPAFPSTLRYMRLLFVLLHKFSEELILETEILFGILLRLVSGHQDTAGSVPRWQRIVALEVTRSLCSDGVFLRNLWSWFDSKESAPTKMFGRLVTVLQATVMENGASIGASFRPNEVGTSDTASARPSSDRRTSGLGFLEAAAEVAGAVLNSASGQDVLQTHSLGVMSAPKIQFVDQVEKMEAPSAPGNYLHFLSLQGLVHLAQSLAQHILPAYSAFVNSRGTAVGVAPSRLELSQFDENKRQDLTQCTGMVQMASGPLRMALFFLLSARLDDTLFCDVLAAVRNWTNVCGVLGLNHARDNFLASLSLQAVPPGERAGYGLSERNLASLQVFLQITIYLSRILDEHWCSTITILCDAEARIRHSTDRYASLKGMSQNSLASPSSATLQSGIPASTFQPGFCLASTLGDGRTGKPHLLANATYETALAAIAKCFENTTALADGAFRHFLEACCACCDALARDVMRSSSSSSQASVAIVLSNLRLLLELNCRRVALGESGLGWDTSVKTLVDLASNESVSSPIRIQAAEVLTAFLSGALDSDAQAGVTHDPQTSFRVQTRIFSSLKVLSILDNKWTTGAVDVRRVGVETIRKIVETHGHALRLGWDVIFEVSLAACCRPVTKADDSIAVAPRSRASLVRTAFATTQNIANDLLAALSLDQLELIVRSLSAFASVDDVNVALTAESSLLDVTAELADRATSEVDEASGTPSLSDKMAKLWLQVLTSFASIALDARVEVRNAAISGLYRVISSYGSLFDPPLCSQTFHAALLPLLDGVIQGSAASRSIRPNSSIAGSPAAADTRRTSSSSKAGVDGALVTQQWEDSVTLAFQQLGRTLADRFLARLVPAPDFSSSWLDLLQRIEATFLRGPPNVSQAAVVAFRDILAIDTAGVSEHEETLQTAWESAWTTWADLADAVPMAQTAFSQANLLALIETFNELYKYQKAPIELAAVLKLQQLSVYARSTDLISDVDQMSELQKLAWEAISSLRAVPGLAPARLKNAAERILLPFTVPFSGHQKRSQQTFIAVHRAAVQDAVNLCTEVGGDDELYSSGALSAVLSALAVPIKLRYECPSASLTAKFLPLWQEACLAFCRIAPEISHRLNGDGHGLSRDTVESIWHHILAVYRAAFEADCSVPPSATSSQPPKEDQGYDVLLLSVFEKHLWPVLGTERTPAALIEQFAASLARASDLCDVSVDRSGESRGDSGISSDTQGEARKFKASDCMAGSIFPSLATSREHFALASLDLLVLLCSDRVVESYRQQRHRVAALSIANLLRRAKRVLSDYVADSALRGGAPLERIRDEEVYVWLSHLLDLRLLPQTLSAASSNDPSQSVAEFYAHSDDQRPREVVTSSVRVLTQASPRAHLFALHGPLVDLAALTGQYPSLSGSALSVPLVEPPVAWTTASSELPAPAGFAYDGLVGHANVLDSRRLDREEPRRIPDLARSCLAVVSDVLVL